VSYTQKYKSAPDQFAAQAFDAVFVTAHALGKIKITGNVEADRKALRDALPTVTWTGATGAFTFKQAMDKAGKPAGYDAKQAAIVSVTKAGKYTIEQ
jgi:branched-chain amino acid transport system substrate-binding protein